MIEVTEQRLVDAEKVRELQKRTEILMNDPSCYETGCAIKWTLEELGLWDNESEAPVTVRDFVSNNENIGLWVVIEQAFSRDTCDPLREELWSGRIEDVPERYRGLEVIGARWAFARQAHVLTVIKDGTKNVLTAGKQSQDTK